MILCLLFATEMLRENKRMLDKAIRELDRERTQLQNEEKKLINEIKKAAKQNQMVWSLLHGDIWLFLSSYCWPSGCREDNGQVPGTEPPCDNQDGSPQVAASGSVHPASGKVALTASYLIMIPI